MMTYTCVNVPHTSSVACEIQLEHTHSQKTQPKNRLPIPRLHIHACAPRNNNFIYSTSTYFILIAYYYIIYIYLYTGAAFHYVTVSMLLWTVVHSCFICLKVVCPIFMKRTEKSHKYIHTVISISGNNATNTTYTTSLPTVIVIHCIMCFVQQIRKIWLLK